LLVKAINETLQCDFSPTCRINRYYDSSTDSFISVDPAVQQTDEPYVFVNGNPLNATDPLGLSGCSWWNAVCDVESGAKSLARAASSVLNFVDTNGYAVGGLALDAFSFTLEGIGAATGEPVVSGFGTLVGAAGTVVSGIGCKKDGGLACVGFTIGAAATTAGIVETGLEAFEIAPGLSKVLSGLSFTLGGATATTDFAAIIVKIHSDVVSEANKVVDKAVSKK
jgi:hypothetical protein